MCLGGGGGDDGSAEARKREQQREARIRQGMSAIDQNFKAFDDNFFNQRRDAYVAYATPQLNEQYDDAVTRLTAALSRSGALQSSEAAKRQGRLARDFQTQRQGLIDKGTELATQGRTDLENARSALVTDLYATADPAAAAAGAQARAKIASQTPGYTPLGQLFQDITSGLADWAEARSYNKAFASTAPGATAGKDSGRLVG
ncbi:MAG TPA: hypothetical protein VGE88_07020 [Lysobacter sp.]